MWKLGPKLRLVVVLVMDVTFRQVHLESVERGNGANLYFDG